MTDKHIFRISFYNQDEVYEIYARTIRDSEIFGFLEAEEFVFGKHTSVVVDPSEERLKMEFEGVRQSLIPMHSIIRIDEVVSEGIAKIKDGGSGSNVSIFPRNYSTKPDRGSDKS